MRDMITSELAAADAGFGRRLEEGSYRHAVRRAEEMAATTELLDSLGVPARISAASRDWLRDLIAERADGSQPGSGAGSEGRTT